MKLRFGTRDKVLGFGGTTFTVKLTGQGADIGFD